MKFKNVFILLLIVLLVACSNRQTPVISSPILTTTELIPNSTPIFLPTEIASLTRKPTATSQVATSKAQETLDAAVQLCPGGISPIYPSATFSPNGKWISVVCLGEDLFSKFMSNDGTLYWEIPRKRIFHWSNDGNYAYLIPDSIAPKPNSPELLFEDGNSLYRLNLKTGAISTAIPPYSPNTYSFSFSPNDRYLVYSSHPQNFSVHILDIYSGVNIQFSMSDDYSRAGVFSWSPDGEKVVFTAAGKGDWYNFESSFSIYIIDTSTKQITLLLNRPPHNYFADRWISDNKIHVNAFDGAGEYELDILTRNFVEIINTLTPIP